ncbi:MAG: PAS domain-containing protein, partial [Candidatus Rickettsiella isopodorum]
MPKKKEHYNNFSKKDYFDYLLTLTPSSVYWKDLNGVYLGCNLSMLEMVGLSSIREIIGKTDYDLPWKESAGTLQKNDQEVIKSGTLQSFEETGKLSNGNTITVICNKMPLVNKSGEIIGSIGSSIDISRLKKTEIDLKKAKEAAEAASHAKTEFLENMRHDIRTPMSGIVGCARIIQSKPNDPETVS